MGVLGYLASVLVFASSPTMSITPGEPSACAESVGELAPGPRGLNALKAFLSLKGRSDAAILEMMDEYGETVHIQMLPDRMRAVLLRLGKLPRWLGGSMFHMLGQMPSFTMTTDAKLLRGFFGQHTRDLRRVYKSLSVIVGEESFFIQQDDDPKGREIVEKARTALKPYFHPGRLRRLWEDEMKGLMARLQLVESLPMKGGDVFSTEDFRDRADWFAIGFAVKVLLGLDLSSEEIMALRPILDKVFLLAEPEKTRAAMLELINPVLQ